MSPAKKVLHSTTALRLLLGASLLLAYLAYMAGAARADNWLEATVIITDKGFNPPVLTVPLNTRVTWINKGTKLHTTTDDRMYWDSGALNPVTGNQVQPGTSFSFLFTTYDVWTYHSEVDQVWSGGARYLPMTGAIVVTGAVTAPTGKLPLPSQQAPEPTPTPLPPNRVLVFDGQFYPSEVHVKVGDTVVWTNFGWGTHTVTDDNKALFDSGGLSQPQDPPDPGQTFAYRFTRKGTYGYHSETDVDPTNPKSKWLMHGTVVVE